MTYATKPEQPEFFSFFSTINEIKDITKALDLRTETLIAFDLDNTLLYPDTLEAQDAFFRGIRKLYEQLGLTPEEANTRSVNHIARELKKARVHFVDPATPGCIKSIQEYPNVRIMGLTARSRPLISSTHHQLLKLGLNFRPQEGPWARPYYFFKNKIRLDAYYSHAGILFCGPNDKGAILEEFLTKKVGYLPEKLIFIDDHVDYITMVAACAQRLSIKSFHGFHFVRPLPNKS